MKGQLLIYLILLTTFCHGQNRERVTVYFSSNDYMLDDYSKSRIDSAVKNIAIKEILISAYCDSVGNISYNDSLSIKRGQTVRAYLEGKQLGESKINMKAYGKRAPLNKNTTEAERALNRRAEIVFVLKDTTTIKIEDAEVGSTVRMKNLNFIGGRHTLVPQSIPILEGLLNTLKNNPTLEIEIDGHICCKLASQGDGEDFDDGSTNLSLNRAKAIYDYLIAHEIEASRLSYKGFGATHKLVPEYSEADMAMNRRVEIKIIKK